MQGKHIKAHMHLALSVAALNVLRNPDQLLLKTEQRLGQYLERQARRNWSVDMREVTGEHDAYFSIVIDRYSSSVR